MPFSKHKVHNILVISLSNIGDVILTFPVVDILRRDFSDAQLDIVVGPKAQSLLEGNENIRKVIVFDKRNPFYKTFSWMMDLRTAHYDLVIDLRCTMFPLFLGARYRTPFWDKKHKLGHMKEKHLNRLRRTYRFSSLADKKYCFAPSEEDRVFVEELICQEVGEEGSFVLVSPGAADAKKRWSEKNFAALCDDLVKLYQVKIVFAGDENDRKIAQAIDKIMDCESVNICGRTTLSHLALLTDASSLVVANDSAPMHLASYLDKPTVGIFGPTNADLYGPWGVNGVLAERKKSCLRCQGAKTGEHTCLDALESEDVLRMIKEGFLTHESE